MKYVRHMLNNRLVWELVSWANCKLFFDALCFTYVKNILKIFIGSTKLNPNKFLFHVLLKKKIHNLKITETHISTNAYTRFACQTKRKILLLVFRL